MGVVGADLCIIWYSKSTSQLAGHFFVPQAGTMTMAGCGPPQTLCLLADKAYEYYSNLRIINQSEMGVINQLNTIDRGPHDL